MKSLQQITDEPSVKDALKGVFVGDNIRITFKTEAGKEMDKLGQLRNKLSFDQEWFTMVIVCVVPTGEWEGILRTQDFTITRMSAADREVFAHILAKITESIEVI